MADSDYVHVTKRLKVDPSPCPVVDGVVCASQSSSVEEELPAFINPKQNALRVFISHGTDTEISQRRASYQVSQRMMNALKDIDLDENGLRDEVYQELKNHHSVVFPESSTNSEFSGTAPYAEDTPDNLLNEFFTSTIGMAQSDSKLRKIARGLPVTTTSLPGATVIRVLQTQEQQEALDNFQKIVHGYCLMFGEFKHGPKYRKREATVQCVLYLYAIIFWLRTKLGLPVKAVYGFAFCGHKCNDHRSQTKGQTGTYSVGLIKVSLPTTLSGKIKTECSWTGGDTKDKKPLQTLIDFLKHGNCWEFASSIPRITEIPRLVPSLFMLPVQYWQDSENRKLVLNGTMAIVFHVKQAGLLELLEAESQSDLDWSTFEKEVKHTTDQNDDDWFYLKIRSRETTLQSHPGYAMQDTHTFLAETYPVRPYVDVNFCFVLMRDQGKALRADAFKTVGELCYAFQPVLDLIECLRSHLAHGDALEHNFVLHSDKRLRVIDFDEGVANDDALPVRKVVYTSRENRKTAPFPNWYAAMRYPNYVREHNQNYSQIQLIAAFIKLVERSGIDEADAKAQEEMTQLLKKAEKIGTVLHEGDVSNGVLNFEDQEPFFDIIDEAYNAMTTFVRNQTPTDLPAT